jgi:hypothetical protein
MNRNLLASRALGSDQSDLAPDVFSVVDDVDHHGAYGTGCSNQSQVWFSRHGYLPVPA